MVLELQNSMKNTKIISDNILKCFKAILGLIRYEQDKSANIRVIRISFAIT